MNKEMIERIALEVAGTIAAPFVSDECLTRFARELLARIDAERGKGAVAWRLENGISGEPCLLNHKFFHDMEPLFLSPTIPEGMALVPVEPTPAMCDVIGNRYGAYETAEELYEALIAAAQGEQK